MNDECVRYAVRYKNGKYATGNRFGDGSSFKIAKLYLRRYDAEIRAKRDKGEVVPCHILATG